MFNNILPYASENVQIFMNNNYSPTTIDGYGTISYDEYIWNSNAIKNYAAHNLSWVLIMKMIFLKRF